MSHATESSARTRGEELKPEGKNWTVRVWDNNGWHVSWLCGPVAVYETISGRFHALLSYEADKPGTGNPAWSTTNERCSDSVEGAASKSVAAFRKYVKENPMRDWAAIERVIAEKVEGKKPEEVSA